MHPSQRPPTTTSWVQMSAAGASPLAAAAASHANRRTNLPSATSTGQTNSSSNPLMGECTSAMTASQRGGPFLDPITSSGGGGTDQDQTGSARLSFISTSSTSSAASSSVASISSSASHQHPQYQFGSALQTSAGSRLASVLGASSGGGPSTGTNSLLSSSSTTSSSASASGVGPAGAQAALGLAGSASAVATTATGSTTSSFQSCAGGGATTNEPSLLSMSLSATPSQQLQAAMGELHLAEQQLLLGGAGVGDPLHYHDQNAMADHQEAQQREAARKLRLQLYVFVLRCISYPFNAKQQATGDHRQQQLKLRKAQLEQIVQAHARFMRSSSFSGCAAAVGGGGGGGGETGSASLASAAHLQHLGKVLTESQMKQLLELQERAHASFERRVLQNERMRLLVEAECCSQQDLRDLFRQNAERILKESQLFITAHQQQRQHQHQQQRANLMGGGVSQMGQTGGQGSSSTGRGGGTGSGGARSPQSVQQEQQQASDYSQQAYVQLLNNREAILNAWLIGFESAIRHSDDSAGSLDDGSSTSSALGTLGAAASRGTLAASGPSLASNLSAAGTASPSDQAQQQQQMSKEQLYQMFQSILNIKKFEHQLLYNALQLDSSDEQAAAIRRELDGRVARIAELERNKKLLPKFVLKEMESLYLEETRMAVNKLMVNLDSLPVIKSSSHQTGESRGVYSGLQKFRRYNSRTQASLTRDGLAESHPSEPQLSKLDVVLSFNIEVIVMEVRGLRNISSNREIYCTMEIEGSETGRLQTEHVLAKKPLWDTQGDFVTNHPLPILKIKLYAVNPSMLSLEDKELGKLVLRPSVLSPKTPEWCTMLATSGSDKFQSGKDSASGGGGANNGGSGGPGSDSSPLAAGSEQQSGGGDQLKIRVIVRMDRPQQLKHCGFLYGVGKSTWRKFRRRYHILIQVSQYTFVMCDFREKKSKPNEMLQLDGYTVDYIEPPTDLIMEHCSEITSNEHAHHHHHHGGQHHSSGSSGTFGLAGRLAKPFLKSQQSPLSSLVGGGGAGGSGAGSGGSAAAFADDPSGVIGLDSSSGQEQSQPSAIQTAAALSDELHNKFYFNVVKEGDSVVFACDDEQECFGWVMALYRATGQAHKPTPLRDQYSSSASSTHYIDAAFAYNASASGREQTKLVGAASPSSASSLLLSSMLNGSGSSSVVGSSCSTSGGATGVGGGGVGGGGSSSNALMLSKSSVDVANQRARKHGMDEFISADPCKFQHNQLFKHLQDETLRFRLNDQYLSLGWFSSGQLFVLDEYCARYGVRTCFRHLSYLNSLLDFNVRGYFIDHTLINYGYDFCSSFVSGQSGQLNPMSSVNFDLRPDGTVGTVTVEERDLFHSVKQKLLKMIERQLANFPYCFPYGKPDGALKSTLSLLERVLMKQESAANQMSSMLQNDEVRNLIRKCLEQAALNNYTKLSGQANLLLPPAASGPTSCGSSVNQQGRRQLLNGQQQSTESNPSGQSSPSCSPQPQQLSDPFEGPGSAGSNTTGGGSFLIRKRTQSNLSGGGVSSSNGSSSNYSPNASMRGSHQRFTNQDQQQQPQCITMAMIINHDQVKPQEKLRYLIRLAELCCEQVEENNEYFADAFAWHSDLMTDHFELFWSLFSVDMDKVLAELNGQTGQPTNQQGNQQQQSGIVAAVAMPLGRTISSSSGGVAQQGGTTAGTGQAGQGGHCASISSASGQSSDLLGVNNRDIFALFQVLNNHMRKPTNTFECRKFRAYLCDTFKPKLLRYIDIMESTLTRMVFKACEKEGQVNCRLIEQMFVRLDELQVFVLKQLRWPDEQLAEQLHQRLKLIAYELCDAIVQRTLLAFQQLEKRSNKWTTTTTSYNSPVEMIQMINLTLDTRNRSLKLCTFNGFDQMSYHSKIDKLIESALGEMQPGLMAKMLNALDSTLNKLARFDEGNLLAPILSLTYKQGMSSSGRDIGKQYVSFVSNCCDLIRHKINDEIWIVSLLEDWYAAQMNTICGWLAERIDRSLHDVQLVALANIMPKIYADMSLQGVSEDKLNLKSYQTIMSRLKMEEASSLAGGTLFEQPSTSSSIFNTSLLSSLTSSSSSSSSVATGGPVSLGGGQSTTGGATGSAQQPSTPQQLQQQQQQYQLGHQHMGQLRPQSSGGSLGSGQQQQQQQQFMSNAPGTPVWRTGNVSSINGPPSSGQLGGGEQRTDEQGDNIADRALQSATRMFKGFWN